MRHGFTNVRVVDEAVTGTDEQRSIDWMAFQSLADFLDPNDPSKPREGHPAPQRAVVMAEKPKRTHRRAMQERRPYTQPTIARTIPPGDCLIR